MCEKLSFEESASFKRALISILQRYFPLTSVSKAGNAQKGLRALAQLRPGLIGMDVQLPVENGQEVTRKIKLIYEDIEIDILTSCTLSKYHQQALHDSANYFLSKGADSCLKEALVQVKETMVSKSYH